MSYTTLPNDCAREELALSRIKSFIAMSGETFHENFISMALKSKWIAYPGKEYVPVYDILDIFPHATPNYEKIRILKSDPQKRWRV